MNYDAGFLCPVNDPQGRLREILATISTMRSPRGRFVLSLAGTETSDRDSISSAGATAELRRLTPCADAEALILGRTITGAPLPTSPVGVVSPVVLTRPCLKRAAMTAAIVDCGTFKTPEIPAMILGKEPARCVSTGKALDFRAVEQVFDSGMAMGHNLAASQDYLVLAECVPGGTTTAMGLLSAFDLPVKDLLSSSNPTANHDLRRQLVEEGLAKAALTPQILAKSPLKAVAAVGDAMQAFVAGIAIIAAARRPVILAGGSQMLAVYALLNHICKAEGIPSSKLEVAVITTKWVAYDKSARMTQLSRLVDAPFGAACPEFRQSRHAGLQAYEDGHVKEGVGAGAAMALAHLVGGASGAEIMHAIDRAYDEMVKGKESEPSLYSA